MKALTVKQPHASLLLGPKRIETRTWATKHRGPLLIHAGLAIDPDGPWHMISREIVLPRGVLIGKLILIDCRPMTKEDEPLACCAFRVGLFAWVTERPETLVFQTPVKGKLGLWEYKL